MNKALSFVLLVAVAAVAACKTEPPAARCADPAVCPVEWPQWPMRTTAPAKYVATADTVNDEVTGLMWQRVVPAEMRRWEDAKSYCEGLDLAGQADWRLPSRIELVTLVEYERSGFLPDKKNRTAIDETAFPATPPAEFWTAANVDTSAWTVSFFTGELGTEPIELLYPRTRCVRTERAPKAELTTRESRFAISAETVKDRATGLVWQREIGNFVRLREIMNCEDLVLDGRSGFRVPHVKELLSLALATVGDRQGIDREVFEEIRPNYGSVDILTSTPAGTIARQTGGTLPALLVVDFADRGRVGRTAQTEETMRAGAFATRCVLSEP